MTTDWKALCAELANALAEEYGVEREFHSGDLLLESGSAVESVLKIELLYRARNALDQPELEEPTEEELMALAVTVFDNPFSTDKDYARAVLARWGRPAIKPVLVSERPWDHEGWCDGDGWCWCFDADSTDPCWSFDRPEAWVCWTHVLPHYALPVPIATQETP